MNINEDINSSSANTAKLDDVIDAIGKIILGKSAAIVPRQHHVDQLA